MATDPSEITPRDNHNLRTWAIWTGLWVFSLIGTQSLFNVHLLGDVAVVRHFRRELVPAGVLHWLVAALPLLIGAGSLWFWLRYLREADELQRRIELNAVAFGFGVTFVWITSYRALTAAGAPTLEQNLLMMPGLGAYILARLYGRWQYR
jgi:hypothetical protein